MEAPLIEPSGALCCTDCWPAVQSVVTSLTVAKPAYDAEAVIYRAYKLAGGLHSSYKSWRAAYGGTDQCRDFLLAGYPREWRAAYQDVTGQSWPK